MQSFHEKIGNQLVEATQRYMNNEIELDELLKMQERECLVFDHKKWPEIKTNLRTRVFQLTKQLFSHINECEKYLRTFESLYKDVELDCDIDQLVSHAFFLGRNRMPQVGFEHSNWYLGPYPTIQMIEALREEPTEK
ncbi:hypothetical protein GINT2_000254 [Glugoides intestinalis]